MNTHLNSTHPVGFDGAFQATTISFFGISEVCCMMLGQLSETLIRESSYGCKMKRDKIRLISEWVEIMMKNKSSDQEAARCISVEGYQGSL